MMQTFLLFLGLVTLMLWIAIPVGILYLIKVLCEGAAGLVSSFKPGEVVPTPANPEYEQDVVEEKQVLMEEVELVSGEFQPNSNVEQVK